MHFHRKRLISHCRASGCLVNKLVRWQVYLHHDSLCCSCTLVIFCDQLATPCAGPIVLKSRAFLLFVLLKMATRWQQRRHNGNACSYLPSTCVFL
jgi:hypothetical protein